jgi:predicted RNA methylase
MNFPFTRHFQRYEYITRSGYIDDKTVLDLGCGTIGTGAYLLTSRAKFVIAIDKKVVPSLTVGLNMDSHSDRLVFVCGDLYNFDRREDVVVAIEVFEHMEDPKGFISHTSGICDYAFITTPLAETTEKTKNLEHVFEYSSRDFDGIVEDKFEILDKVYQHGDLSITKEAKSNGCSFDYGHVVQMVWARSRNGR